MKTIYTLFLACIIASITGCETIKELSGYDDEDYYTGSGYYWEPAATQISKQYPWQMLPTQYKLTVKYDSYSREYLSDTAFTASIHLPSGKHILRIDCFWVNPKLREFFARTVRGEFTAPFGGIGRGSLSICDTLDVSPGASLEFGVR